MSDLAALVPIGWNERLADAADAVSAEHVGAIPGRVTRVDRGMVNVLAADGPVRAVTGADPLATGDLVLVDPGDEAPIVVARLMASSLKGQPRWWRA